ncbi:unnamed protein product [Wickerhamomyces anomalus]
MSNSWIRGPRCGVDNCRSKFYRSVDGRRICQFGHVNEGHIEFNDDDDDNFIVTRRLNIPTVTTGLSQASQITPGLQKDEAKRKLYGAAGRELYYKCFQCVLKSQIKSLINDHGLPEILEVVVKRYYVQYISMLNDIDTVEKSNGKLDDDDDEEEEEHGEYRDSEGFTTQDTSFTNDTSNEDHEFGFTKLPTHIDSLALCYLGCRYLNLPIFINDFVQWTTTNRIPYMRASFNVPKVLRDKLSMGKVRSFEPKRPPLKGDLCFAISKVATSLNLNHLELNYEPLLFKAIKELILSPQIYFATKKFLKLKLIKLDIKPFKGTKTAQSYINEFPEIKLISIIISITKLYFINGSVNENQPTYDWKKWKELLGNLDLDQDDDNKNFHNVLTQLLLSKNSSLEVIDWDEEKTNKYLDWFTHKIVNTQATEEGPAAMKRLFDIFKLPEDDSQEENLQQQQEQQPQSSEFAGKDVKSIESAYTQLIESGSNKEKLSDEEVMELEKFMIENLISNFGVTTSQLTHAVRHVEQKFFFN